MTRRTKNIEREIPCPRLTAISEALIAKTGEAPLHPVAVTPKADGRHEVSLWAERHHIATVSAGTAEAALDLAYRYVASMPDRVKGNET